VGAWCGPKPLPLLVFLPWLFDTLIDSSQKLWHLILKLGFMFRLGLVYAYQNFCIKVATFYLFKALICMVFAPLAHQDFFFFCWIRSTWHTQLVCYSFRGLTHFQALGARDRYKALTILCLSFKKVLSLINFLDYLTFCMLILLLLGLSLMFWCLLSLASIYEHVWMSPRSSC